MGMSMANLDTHQAIKELQDAGVEPPQAEAMVGVVSRMMTDGLATKKDVQALEAKVDAGFAAVDAKLSTKVAALDTKVENGLTALNTKIDTKVDALDAKIDASVAALNTKIDTKVDALDTKIDNNVAMLAAKIETQTHKTIIWLGGALVGATGFLMLFIRVFMAVPAQ